MTNVSSRGPKRPMFGWLGVMATLMLSCSEPKVCTLIGCGPPLSVELQATDWVAGEYVVSIETSVRSFECRFTRGSAGAGGQAGAPAEIPGLVRHCDQVSGDPSEYAPEFWGDEDVTIDLERHYEQLRILVRRDGALLLDEELTPKYETYHPNGPDCGECRSAPPATLTLPEES